MVNLNNPALGPVISIGRRRLSDNIVRYIGDVIVDKESGILMPESKKNKEIDFPTDVKQIWMKKLVWEITRPNRRKDENWISIISRLFIRSFPTPISVKCILYIHTAYRFLFSYSNLNSLHIEYKILNLWIYKCFLSVDF